MELKKHHFMILNSILEAPDQEATAAQIVTIGEELFGITLSAATVFTGLANLMKWDMVKAERKLLEGKDKPSHLFSLTEKGRLKAPERKLERKGSKAPKLNPQPEGA